jgi:membrane associated rhomboid family serine protease
MRLPERGDGGAPRPWATWALVGTALAVQLAAPDAPARYVLVPAAPGLLALVAHLFLHAGWAHLFGTLAFLALAGPPLEARLGKRLFLSSFVAAGLAGAALFVATHPGAETPWLGGSAAVAGLLGLLLASAGRRRIELFAIAAGLAPSLRAPAWSLVAVFFGRELAGLASAGESALVAHSGSFAFGAVLAFALGRTGALAGESVLASDVEPRAAESRATPQLTAPRLRAKRARPERRLPEDPTGLAAQLAEADAPEVARAYLDGEEAAGRGAAARSAVEGRLWEAVEGRRCAPAVALWCALVEEGPVPAGPAEPLLQLAGWLRGAGHAAAGTLALHAALATSDPAAAAKIARATRRSDPVVCYRAAVRALDEPTLASSERDALLGLRTEAEREVAARGIVLVPRDARAPEPAPAAPVVVRAPVLPEPPRKRALGEAIELEPEPELVLPPPALPDPAEAGDAAFLDAFHAALSEPEEVAKPEPETRPLRRLRVREALPRALETDALLLEVPGRKPVRLPLAKLHGVALAGVRGLSERAGDKPVLIVDLLLSPEAEAELNLLRLRSDRFDPRMLSVAPEASPLKALRSFVGELATAAHAPLLPAADVSGEGPLRIFKDLASYEREVLHAG